MISIRIVDRKYLIGGRWLRFEKMIVNRYNLKRKILIGYKIAIGRYEIRLYL